MEGRRIKLPLQLSHAQIESNNPDIGGVFTNGCWPPWMTEWPHSGLWALKTVYPHAYNNSGNLIAYTRQIEDEIKLVVVNLSPLPAQGRILFQDNIQESQEYVFTDRLNGDSFQTERGLDGTIPG